MPVALARLALQSIVVLSHCSDALVAILASVGVVVDDLARWLLGRHGLFRARECRRVVDLCALRRLALNWETWLNITDRILDKLHDFLEFRRRVYHACDQRLAALQAETHRFESFLQLQYSFSVRKMFGFYLLATAVLYSTQRSVSCNARTTLSWS